MWASKGPRVIHCLVLCGSRCNWWLASVTSGSSSNCVLVYYDGHSHYWTSASGELCVPVCFIIK